MLGLVFSQAMPVPSCPCGHPPTLPLTLPIRTAPTSSPQRGTHATECSVLVTNFSRFGVSERALWHFQSLGKKVPRSWMWKVGSVARHHVGVQAMGMSHCQCTPAVTRVATSAGPRQ